MNLEYAQVSSNYKRRNTLQCFCC